jgi:hypothetical protein
VASHSGGKLKAELEHLLSEARELSAELARVLEHTSNYDLVRQLKKVDAEMLDVQHNLALALELEESGRDANRR